MDASIFVLLHPVTGRVLMELRPPGDPLPGLVFPGGKMQPGETSVEAMLREADEELGVVPLEYHELALGRRIFYARSGEAHRVHPYLVRLWEGDVPETILDSGAILSWRLLSAALRSPVAVAREIAEAILEYQQGGA